MSQRSAASISVTGNTTPQPRRRDRQHSAQLEAPHVLSESQPENTSPQSTTSSNIENTRPHSLPLPVKRRRKPDANPEGRARLTATRKLKKLCQKAPAPQRPALTRQLTPQLVSRTPTEPPVSWYASPEDRATIIQNLSAAFVSELRSVRQAEGRPRTPELPTVELFQCSEANRPTGARTRSSITKFFAPDDVFVPPPGLKYPTLLRGARKRRRGEVSLPETPTPEHDESVSPEKKNKRQRVSLTPTLPVRPQRQDSKHGAKSQRVKRPSTDRRAETFPQQDSLATNADKADVSGERPRRQRRRDSKSGSASAEKHKTEKPADDAFGEKDMDKAANGGSAHTIRTRQKLATGLRSGKASPLERPRTPPLPSRQSGTPNSGVRPPDTSALAPFLGTRSRKHKTKKRKSSLSRPADGGSSASPAPPATPEQPAETVPPSSGSTSPGRKVFASLIDVAILGPAISRFGVSPPPTNATLPADSSAREDIEHNVETAVSEELHTSEVATEGNGESVIPEAMHAPAVTAVATPLSLQHGSPQQTPEITEDPIILSEPSMDAGSWEHHITASEELDILVDKDEAYPPSPPIGQESGLSNMEVAAPSDSHEDPSLQPSVQAVDVVESDIRPQEGDSLTAATCPAEAQPAPVSARREERARGNDSESRQSLTRAPRTLTRHDSTLSLLLGERLPHCATGGLERTAANNTHSSPIKSQSQSVSMSLSFDFEKEIGEITHFLEDDVDLARPRSAGLQQPLRSYGSGIESGT
ncbi:hypothetical protein BDZ88DRAFT_404313 [Geranomyces variabilis]|nr:hypothetical protein BDZ88DRAFT_404313 [Geranomyces variabilis]KAJ3143543.1 hypothetical protein HDU90_000306 [Geranomyces variabilis]